MPGIEIVHTSEPKHDGIESIYFSQSWLNTWLSCPELAWQELQGLVPWHSTDATAIGTALHKYAETRCLGGDTGAAYDAAVHGLDAEMATDGFTMVQVQSRDMMDTYLDRVIGTWEDHCYPQIVPLFVEKPMEAVLGWVGDVEFGVKGTPDLIDLDGALWDWKTALAPYQTWEYERWALQPTIYTYLLNQNYEDVPKEIEFTYFVSLKTGAGRFQQFSVERGPEHWDWLKTVAERAVRMILSMPDGFWPLNDQSWKCSPKWCPKWDTCKGSHFKQGEK